MTTEERAESEPSEADVASVRDAAVGFVGGLTTAFGLDADVTSTVEGSEIEVRVDGSSLGLLIGPGGRTLLAIQDLARVAAQRRLGDHDTPACASTSPATARSGAWRSRSSPSTVAEQVKESGVARSLDPMPSADRKVLHDALAAIDGVSSRSEGEDPTGEWSSSPADGWRRPRCATPWRRRSASGCSAIVRSPR